jgi:hypothetical protein
LKNKKDRMRSAIVWKVLEKLQIEMRPLYHDYIDMKMIFARAFVNQES